ncbi:MAG: DNA translocase FtsK 4TM domain-containing protein, partial [Bacteroidota bacterium]|nr:DNA translocase FtsK 4TM domain-containing protein [Bacteroidota bacterium]
MANRLKKNVPPPPDPEKLQPDKEVDISVSEVVKDERTTKIAGAVSLLFAFFLFIAFSSYLFTWQEDQDKVQQFGVKIFSLEDLKINNLLGVSGAYLAHFFMYKGFGIAAYLLCTFFFVLGVNGLFSKKVFSVKRNIRYVLVGLVLISVTASFTTPNSQFTWGGAVGNMLSSWLIQWMGKVGTSAFLLIAVFSYIIWRFNPTFHLPKWPERASTKNKLVTEDDSIALSSDEIPVYQQWDTASKTDIPLDVQPNNEEPWVTSNKLKNDGKNVTVILPEDAVTDPTNPLIQFEILDKHQYLQQDTMEAESPDEIITPSPAQHIPPANDSNITVQATPSSELTPIITSAKLMIDDSVDMELEIKTSTIESTPVAVKKSPPVLNEPYDTTLDLSSYQFPSLDLLDLHGSEKIVHDPNELEANKNQ